MIRQGEVYWIDLREPVGSGPGYRHPYVVVQNDLFNQSRINTVVVCALTSNLKRARVPGNVLLRPGEGRLPRIHRASGETVKIDSPSDTFVSFGNVHRLVRLCFAKS